MTLALLAGLILGAIALPHALPRSRVSPGKATATWLAALALRALTSVLGALAVVVYIPGTSGFRNVTHWCWHTVLPDGATHLRVSGHHLGVLALSLPAALIAASVLSGTWALWRAVRAVRSLLRRDALGVGPEGAVIVGGQTVLLAAAGLTHPTVVVSTGALTALDDAELAAGLEHERGHIARRHRYILLFAAGCRALGALLPGTKRAAAELAYHLERDADAYAVARRHEPLALASAICKAATGRPAAAFLIGLGGGGHLQARVQELIDPRPPSVDARWGRLAVALTTLLVSLAVLLVAAVPALALDGAGPAPLLDHACPR